LGSKGVFNKLVYWWIFTKMWVFFNKILGKKSRKNLTQLKKNGNYFYRDNFYWMNPCPDTVKRARGAF
jgi:hypothetical protein